MTTTARKITLNLNDELIEAIDELRVMTRGEDIASRSQIVRELLTRAIVDLFDDLAKD